MTLEVNIERIVEENGEYPVFVRGTCVEEALWLLGINRGLYESKPDIIYAFSIIEGFTKAGIAPIKPIPETYTLRRMREHAIAWAQAGNEEKSSLYHFGNEDHARFFGMDEGRLGVVVYFSPRIIESIGYNQDDYDENRMNELCAVGIPINDAFEPQNVCLVEPLGPVDYKVLQKKVNKKVRILLPVFKDWDEICSYLGGNEELADMGFEFPP